MQMHRCVSRMNERDGIYQPYAIYKADKCEIVAAAAVASIVVVVVLNATLVVIKHREIRTITLVINIRAIKGYHLMEWNA